jgi:serine/threonine protein kinase/cephalosporin-C deacetylase-like acetyl esterase
MAITPGQWQRVKDLYEEVQSWSGEERTARLDSEPDAVVRAEVLRLLSEQQKLGSFLSTPAFARNASDAPPQARMSPGQILAERFRILEFLAAGGMGEVYKAEDTRLDRLVALKFLPRELAEDCESLERLHREAKAASGLNHPNICTVYDFGQDGERAFIAMEYLEGQTLSARIKQNPLPLNDTLNISIAVANALSAAHRKGIVHRDLKPGNIILTHTGPKLLDFGLAKHEQPAAQTDETLTELTGVGRIVGTLPYMSPEQLLGTEVDARGDIFAFGAVLYEMLTGKRAFERKSRSDTVAALDLEEPQPVREVVKGIPERLERIIGKCLRKRADERYRSVEEIEEGLEECRAELAEPTSGINARVLWNKSKKPQVAVAMLLVLVLLVGGGAWLVHRSMKIRWAREEALPRISKLIEQDKIGEAYALAVQAEGYIPKDPILAKLWPAISWSDSIRTVPTGASVYRRNYNAGNSAWEFVGHSPIEKRRFASVDSNWKFELKGYRTVERATFPSFLFSPAVITLNDENSIPPGMVRVDLITPDGKPPQVGLYGLPGLETFPAIPMESYWIDRFEVTNAEFKRFVDRGGYQKQEYWKHEFKKDGHLLSWADAMKFFQDSTGRPGPATWIQGEYPHGQDNYPVAGVSWFEAMAYAEFVGKALPTIYHWRLAAHPYDGPSMIPASNFGGQGPAIVGTYRGMSVFGAYDMAGNVKEWVFNDDGSGKHYILGGAWSEPSYAFYDPDARSPFQRSANFGFRCAKYLSNDEFAKAAIPITAQVRDYNSERPVSDQLFAVYKSLYSYDKTPLNAVVESIQQTDDWKEEKITFDAAYANERVIAYLFLPLKVKPPYQTVLHFPPAGALYTQSSAHLDGYLENIEFMIKGGRAVMFTVYKGTFERGANSESSPWPNKTIAYRDKIIMWSKDLGRSIDYLETRPDIDHNKLAYEGYSLGAALGSLLPAVENRFEAVVLICGGFWLQKRLPEVDQLNFAPRVKAPVLLLSGRFDYVFPMGTSQEPMFRLLGSPKEDKRQVVYNTGHDIPDNEVIKETLNWLDRYLGPVK